MGSVTGEGLGQAARIERRSHFRGRGTGRSIGVRYRPVDASGFGASGAGGDGIRAAETDDIGIGGAFVRSRQPLAVGSRIALEVHLAPGEAPIAVTAEVRWVAHGEPSGMGLRFDGLGTEARLALSEYFASLT